MAIRRFASWIRKKFSRKQRRMPLLEELLRAAVKDPSQRNLWRREASIIYSKVLKITDSPRLARKLFIAAMHLITGCDPLNLPAASRIVERIISVQRNVEEAIAIIEKIRRDLIGHLVELYELIYANPAISVNELEHLQRIGYFSNREDTKYWKYKKEFFESIKARGINYAVKIKERHTFPDGHTVSCPIIVLESPPGKEIFLLGTDSGHPSTIAFVQGAADKQAVENAKRLLGKHPAEFLLEHYLRVAIPTFYTRGIPIIFSNLSSQHSYQLTKALLERFFTKTGLLNPRKKRVQQLLSEAEKPIAYNR
ncbi:MAG: hypothetical protein J7L14_00320 [Candidatus Diapherotrites archaeon]|nr:hypothetical protein [Candidatus Diapherotrites archaeon]